MTFGETVRQLRISKGLSQRELAARVNRNFTYISKIEAGKVPPPAEEVIIALADALGAEREQLLALAPKVVDQQELREAVSQDPRIGVLFRRLQSQNLTAAQIEKMLSITSMEEEEEEDDTTSSD